MFTGIIEEIGTVKNVGSGKLVIKADCVLNDTKLGDSIATNGVCLTVTELGGDYFAADVMPETFHRSSLGDLKRGDGVNLERALSLSSRLGGHIVSGHIDGCGRISEFRNDGNAVWITVEASPIILRYIVEKGSVALDGVSLTVAYVDRARFKVSVIPHTGKATTLVSKRVGMKINIENDILAKYVEKLNSKEEHGLSLDFLTANCF